MRLALKVAVEKICFIIFAGVNFVIMFKGGGGNKRRLIWCNKCFQSRPPVFRREGIRGEFCCYFIEILLCITDYLSCLNALAF